MVGLLTSHHDAVVDAQLTGVIQFIQRNAGDQRGALLCQIGGHGLDKGHGAAAEYRHGGFRPDDQIGVRRLGIAHVAIGSQGVVDMRRVPLARLLDIGLDQRYGQRLAHRLGPLDLCQQRTADPDGQQQGSCTQSLGEPPPQGPFTEQAGAEHGEETQQPHPAQRRPASQPGIGVGVALIQPGKTGEKPAAKQLLADPQGGKAQAAEPG